MTASLAAKNSTKIKIARPCKKLESILCIEEHKNKQLINGMKEI